MEKTGEVGQENIQAENNMRDLNEYKEVLKEIPGRKSIQSRNLLGFL